MIKKEDYLKAKETIEKYEEQLRIDDIMCIVKCYNELKVFIQEKRKTETLCTYIHQQTILDKMFELEQKYSVK